MRIDQSTLSMDAISSHKEVETVLERKGLAASRRPTSFRLNLAGDEVDTQGSPENLEKTRAIEPRLWSGTQEVKLGNRQIIEQAVARVLGNGVTVTELQEQMTPQNESVVDGFRSVSSPFAMLFNTTRVEQRIEEINFASSGSIETGDGRSIEFALDLSVYRSETVTHRQFSSLPLLLDPLVLSFDDGLSSLTNTEFSFDLNGDGSLNSISSLSSGSGFLSLDLNKDGVINDGLELFGPQSGHGFQELTEYDLDGNHWIDENDPVFNELLVWLGAGGANEKLVSLKDAGVGAISLSNVDTEFDLKDDAGTLLGTISRAGLFVMENGTPRSLHELDLNLDVSTAKYQNEEAREQETIEQAIGMLHQMIIRRRVRLAQMARVGGIVHQDRESLAQKFWQWHERRSFG